MDPKEDPCRPPSRRRLPPTAIIMGEEDGWLMDLLALSFCTFGAYILRKNCDSSLQYSFVVGRTMNASCSSHHRNRQDLSRMSRQKRQHGGVSKKPPSFFTVEGCFDDSDASLSFGPQARNLNIFVAFTSERDLLTNDFFALHKDGRNFC